MNSDVEDFDDTQNRIELIHQDHIHSDAEEEIFPLEDDNDSDHDYDDDGSESSEVSDSDIEGQEEDDGLPDTRAWGKRTKNFYNTDFVDKDWEGAYRESDEEMAELEEQEAKNLQQQLADQLDDEDFGLDFFTSLKPKDQEKSMDAAFVEPLKISADYEGMSRKEKLDALKKESPELLDIIDDFKGRLEELKDLQPLFRLSQDNKISNKAASTYVSTRYHLILNYLTNASFYLMLKAKRTFSQSHPVIERLVQFRSLLIKLDEVKDAVQPYLETILEQEASNSGKRPVIQNGHEVCHEKKLLKNKKTKKKDAEVVDELTQYPDTGPVEMGEEMMEEEEVPGRREITYQMEKNKGLTVKKKKMHRNPRVKHRVKYQKALKRRKGQYRQPRKEVQKYSGELSGIRASTVKSIKLK